MLRYKHLRLDQDKIERAKKILKAKTETEAMDKALERVIQEERERVRRKELMKRIIELRSSLGKIQEDSAGWVRLARKERILSYDSGA
jgi:DNA repair exonuclease SbcCD ATPase subunit